MDQPSVRDIGFSSGISAFPKLGVPHLYPKKRLCRRRTQTVRRARKGQRRPEEHRHSRGQKVQNFVGGRIPLGVKKTPTTGGFGFARVWNLGAKTPS